jgi:hypothetical protein
MESVIAGGGRPVRMAGQWDRRVEGRIVATAAPIQA